MADLPPTPSSSELDALGARLEGALGDGYVVEGRLGAGGFAVVFQVRDVHLKRKLAVKVLSPDVIASHSVLDRFRREAETVATVAPAHRQAPLPAPWSSLPDSTLPSRACCTRRR